MLTYSVTWVKRGVLDVFFTDSRNNRCMTVIMIIKTHPSKAWRCIISVICVSMQVCMLLTVCEQFMFTRHKAESSQSAEVTAIHNNINGVICYCYTQLLSLSSVTQTDTQCNSLMLNRIDIIILCTSQVVCNIHVIFHILRHLICTFLHTVHI